MDREKSLAFGAIFGGSKNGPFLHNGTPRNMHRKFIFTGNRQSKIIKVEHSKFATIQSLVEYSDYEL